MTSPISGSGPLNPDFNKPLRKAGDSASGARTANTPAAPGGGAADRLELSPAATQPATEPAFDAARVASLRQAIEQGNYPLDSRRIAESFVALERLIGTGRGD